MRRYTNPRTLALFNAIIILLVTDTAYILIGVLYAGIDWWLLLLMSVIIFFTAFLLLWFTLERFFYEKIRLIYKTIRHMKMGEKKERGLRMRTDPLEEVNRQVQEWSEDKQEEIRRLKDMARYRREFLGNISHELKTPIFNIQGYVLTLLDGGLDDPTINKKYLVKTEKSINRMIAIVEDLEAISKLESGELKLEYTRFDIVELTRDIIDFLEEKARKKSISIAFAESYDRPIFVSADKKSIRQVLINLIDNSIKYGADKKGKTRISFFDMDENVLVEVTDNGMGIDQENIPRLFERFYRTDKGRSRDQGGSGLGLAIVKHIIEAHQQVINVRSQFRIGTTFAFTLKKD